MINGIYCAYLMFADDLAIICETEKELQNALDSLSSFCNENGLVINTKKTKCMVFHRGRLPKCSFFLHNKPIQIVNNFRYLGFNFSVQLSFTAHLQSLVAKSAGHCGILRWHLLIRDLPLPLILQIFGCYVLPIFRFGLGLWTSSFSNSAKQSANAVLTKFLKVYLGVPFHANNAIVHYLTNTAPLMHTLQCMASSDTGSFLFPPSLHGYKPSFLSNQQIPEPIYDPIKFIPTYFWRSKICNNLPSYFWNRKQICREIFDLNHQTLCTEKKFHLLDYTSCICLGCGEQMSHYHHYFCTSFDHNS